MSELLTKLLMNGFAIYPQNDKFVVKKNAVPNNPQIIPESEHSSYDEAIEAAIKMLVPVGQNWSVIVRFNRGLGIEYKNLPDVFAETFEAAKSLANSSATRDMPNDPKLVISEIRVRPKN